MLHNEQSKFEHEYVRGRALYGDVQCIIGNGHMDHPLASSLQNERQTDTTENITFPQLLSRTVITSNNRSGAGTHKGNTAV